MTANTRGGSEGKALTPSAAASNLRSQACYAKLLERIVRVDLAPGQRIIEEEMRNDMGFGASPIREAIRRLEYEQLVVVYPRSGTYVAGIDLKGARDLMQLRSAIEGTAASLAGQHGSKHEREQLVALAEEQLKATELHACVDLDAQFHHSVYTMSRNPYLIATARVHFNLALRYWYFCVKEVSAPDWTAVDHTDLAHAIAEGRGSDASRDLQHHIVHDTQSVIEILAGYGL